MVQQQISTNTFGCAKWIVSADATQGTHTTIAAALTSASSGDTIFIRPGTYTENLTLKAGINLTAFDCDACTPNVTIVGKSTFTAAGTVSVSGVRLQTNGDYLLAVTGNSASIVYLSDCYLNCTNYTGIIFSSSSASAIIHVRTCYGDIGLAGKTLYSHSSAGYLEFIACTIRNSGITTTASNIDSGIMSVNTSAFCFPLSSSNSGVINCSYSYINLEGGNVPAITTAGTGHANLTWSWFNSGDQSALAIGTGTYIQAVYCNILSTSADTIAGLGTLYYQGLSFGTPGYTSTISSSVTTQESSGLPLNIANGGSNATTFVTAQGVLVYNGTSLVNYAGPQLSSAGIATNTTQPAFLAKQASTANDVTGDTTVYTLGSTVDLTEIYDQANNFDPTSGIFTAPATGKYLLGGSFFAAGIGAGHTQGFGQIVTSNRSYTANVCSFAAVKDSNNQVSFTFSALADMDAADTATFNLQVCNSTKTVDIYGDANMNTWVSGYLVC